MEYGSQLESLILEIRHSAGYINVLSSNSDSFGKPHSIFIFFSPNKNKLFAAFTCKCIKKKKPTLIVARVVLNRPWNAIDATSFEMGRRVAAQIPFGSLLGREISGVITVNGAVLAKSGHLLFFARSADVDIVVSLLINNSSFLIPDISQGWL